MSGRRRSGRRSAPRRSLACALAGPALATAYPGFSDPERAESARRFLTASFGLHAAAIAVLAILAGLAPELDAPPLRVELLHEEPPPPPPTPEVVIPEPEPVAPPPEVKPAPEPPRVAKVEPQPAPEPRRTPPPPPPRQPPPQIDRMAARPEPVAPPAIPLDRPRAEPARSARPAPELDFAARPALAVPAAPGPTRAPRELPRPEARTSRPLPRLAAAATPAPVVVPPPAAAPPAPPQRAAVAPPRPPPPVAPRAAEPRPSLRGVSLGTLAPCTSDAREQALKQRVVAAARKRALCESPAGRFHLLETKNLNAFLMRIEQAPGRDMGDRCRELAFALDCLASR